MMDDVDNPLKRFWEERVAAWRAQLEQLDAAEVTDVQSEGVRHIEVPPDPSPGEIAEVDQMNAVEAEYGAKLDALWAAANLVNGKPPREERIAKLSPEQMEAIMEEADELRNLMAELSIEREIEKDYGDC